MAKGKGLRLFDDLVGALGAGRAAEAGALYERLRALGPGEAEALLHELELRRAEDKALLLGFHNGRALEAMREMVGSRGSLRQVRGLVLIPFCLQAAPCPHKLIWDSDNCRRCCACAVGPAALFADSLGWPLKVAARARFAPQFVEETKAELVVSLACPHEALAGLLRVRPDVPVYSLPLATPEGYCRNTRANINELVDFAKALGYDWQPPKAP